MDLDVFFLQTLLDQDFPLAIVSHQTHRNQSDDIQMVSLILQYLVCLQTEGLHSEIKHENMCIVLDKMFKKDILVNILIKFNKFTFCYRELLIAISNVSCD